MTSIIKKYILSLILPEKRNEGENTLYEFKKNQEYKWRKKKS
ncbi:hypothetical protein RV10_GL003037 [Enterococcus pallens]|nr:hypothetical protein RV10_GL003037 [Enterococcus pallens]